MAWISGSFIRFLEINLFNSTTECLKLDIFWQQKFIPENSGSQKSEIRCWQGHAPSEISRSESFLAWFSFCYNQTRLVAASCLSHDFTLCDCTLHMVFSGETFCPLPMEDNSHTGWLCEDILTNYTSKDCSQIGSLSEGLEVSTSIYRVEKDKSTHKSSKCTENSSTTQPAASYIHKSVSLATCPFCDLCVFYSF